MVNFDTNYLPYGNSINQWFSSGSWYVASKYTNVNQYPTLDTILYNWASADACVDSFGTNINLNNAWIYRNWQTLEVEVYAWAAFACVWDGLAVESTPPSSTWTNANRYYQGDVVYPSTANAFQYKCLIAGMSGPAEPTWPTTILGTVVDGTVIWVCEAKLDFGTIYNNPADERVIGTPFIQLGCQDAYFGNNQQLSTCYKRIGEKWSKNPATGLAWTHNDLKYIRIGYRCLPVQGGGQVRVAQLYLRVLGTYLT